MLKRAKQYTTTVCLLVCLLQGWAAPVFAEGNQIPTVNATEQEGKAVLQRLIDLEIPSVFYTGQCEHADLSTSADYKSVSEGAIRSLQKAICAVHTVGSALTSAASDREKEDVRTAMREAANRLDDAQTRGLTGNVRNYAAFLEGIAYCRIARTAKVTGLKDPHFCPSRMASIASFQSVVWDSFAPIYLTTSGSENAAPWSELLEEMAGCYESELNEALDTPCGINADLADFREVVRESSLAVYKEVMTSSESPIKAIISRKIKESEGVLEKAKMGLYGSVPDGDSSPEPTPDSLKGKAGKVKDSLAEFEASKQVIKERVDKVTDRYSALIATADEIVSEYDRLKNGLYIENGRNWKDDVDAKLLIVNQEINAARSANGVSPSSWERLRSIPKDVENLREYASSRKKAALSLCQVYFCELMQQRNNMGANAPRKRACATDLAPSNRLCGDGNDISTVQVLVEGSGATSLTIKADDFCKAAGLPDSFRKLNLNPNLSNSCFSSAPGEAL